MLEVFQNQNIMNLLQVSLMILETYWSILKNGTKIPVILLLENKTFITKSKLKAKTFAFENCNNNIVTIIVLLDPNKTHGHDGILIRMCYFNILTTANFLQKLFR